MKTVSYRVYCKALNDLNSKFQHVMLCDMSNDDAPVSIGVNWYSIGTVTTEKADEFAKELKEAIKAAKNFRYNGYEIKY